jgi:hypothetical protein
MSPWLLLGAILVLLVGAPAVLGWWLTRKLTSISHQIRSAIAQDFQQQGELLLVIQDAITNHVKHQGQLVREALDVAPPPEHPLTGLAFLPTDQSSAELERQVKRAEDHAIQDGESIRYLSQRSARSGGPSSRDPLTQRVPRSGPS